jgi:ABC-type Fe3+/spermidine/putrescine transport system ATPase subunit
MTRIVLQQLTKSYPTQRVLDGLSLDVPSGELMALLGPSGSGKSTILKLIAGIEQPDGGDIRFDDRSLLQVPSNRRGAVLMFQRAYLFPFLSVADNIGFGLKMQRMDRETIAAEVARMLDLVELPGIERKRPAQLSGGQQQRVALARALVVRPRVLLLDEPFSSLDSAIRHTLQETVRRIQRELRITTLLVTHDLPEAIAMSDRTALLVDGSIEACDVPQRLFRRPPTRVAAQFMGVSTFLEGRIENGRLHTQWGSMIIDHTDPRPHDAVVAIRPEHLRLLHAPAPNTLPGVVREWAYKGEWNEAQIAIGELLVRVRTNGDLIERGSTVHVLFPAAHLFEVV